MDLSCGSYLKNHTKAAVQKRKISVSQIDRALHNLFAVRMRLGLFDGDPTNRRYGNIGPNQVCTQEHQALALEAAQNGIVLLKNSLPKSNSISLAIIGPNADSVKTLQGNYYGPRCKSVTPLQALRGYVNNTVYHPGCSDSVNCTLIDIEKAVEVAKGADFVVLAVGLDQTQEREEHDRDHLALPGKQEELIAVVEKAAKKPVVLVVLSGGPVDVTFAKNDPGIGSILWAGYPGEAGGLALAEIIFGDHNPGGRLPVTWYPQDYTKVPMTDMRTRAESSSGYPGRTYRFYQGPKVFEFGFGLSYSTYSYKLSSPIQNKLYLNLTMSSHTPTEFSESARYHQISELSEEFYESKSFSVSIEVENQGEMVGKHSVLLFIKRENLTKGSYRIKQLVEFESVKLNPWEIALVEVNLSPCEHLSNANEDGLIVLEEGSRVLFVGDEEYPIDIIF